jgi:hypothetical protein
MGKAKRDLPIIAFKSQQAWETISVPRWRKIKGQKASSKLLIAPIATRSCTGSTTPERPKPGWPASRNTVTMLIEGKTIYPRKPKR